ncbi:alpha-L-fucosidase [Halomontanus rarus]|uniref:alpha-L-fucosidase n=1 Tax=Halomontanus rarus TaxID=3034020 RepID=UPI00293BDC14|nr:alpha-L-fucosidase [Halovivax sp. KZCA124]
MNDERFDGLEATQLDEFLDTRPHSRQVAWQRREFNGFVHFGPNTFTDRAWGTGTEDPDVFAPTGFDPEQWARTAVNAGMSSLVLTVKHHDGFCLWPSRYTDHSVAESDWRNGDGDVVREVADACAAHDLRFGLYLSPADLHEAVTDGGRYGNGSERRERTIPIPVDGADPTVDDRQFTYTVDEYNAYFLNQLYELLTKYGPVHQVWFDDAHPEETQGDAQTYQTSAWYDLVRSLAPEAVISINGPDVRWCGNEGGHTRDAEWSPVPVPPEADSVTDAEYDLQNPDFPDESLLAAADSFAWYPAETDTTIRPDWFYHSEKAPQFDLEELLDLWYRTVGGNAVLLLNLAPDTRGRVPECDVALLETMGEILAETFETDLARDASATTVEPSDRPHGDPTAVLEADRDVYWTPAGDATTGSVTVTGSERRTIDRIVVQEAIEHRGQRITGIAVDADMDGQWRELGREKTVGYKRIFRVDPVETDAIRVRITGALAPPAVSRIALYRSSPAEREL